MEPRDDGPHVAIRERTATGESPQARGTMIDGLDEEDAKAARALVDCDLLGFMSLRRTHEGAHVIDSLESFGAMPNVTRFYREEAPGTPHAPPTWSPELPAREMVNRVVGNFAELRREARATPEGRALFERYYGQWETEWGRWDQIRALVYDGRRFLGFFAAMKNDGRTFTADDAARMEREVLPKQRARIVAARASREDFCGEEAVMVCSAAGRVIHASPGASAWLDAARRAVVGELVRRSARTTRGFLATCIDGVDVRALRLDGEGDIAYLVSLAPTTPILLSPLTDLTARQREIAEYAAAGATHREIAETLALSPHTVRDHLKAVYRVLDIGSRAELARVVGDGVFEAR